jgi:nicotinate-nucleotide--dimethylbenzimidazole phosphoribosyltransferase
MARWQRTTTPSVARPVGLVFAGDHGVAAAGDVSAFPTEVTASMLAAFEQERGTVNAFARAVGAEMRAVDVGVGRPTGDIRFESAVSPGRFDEIVEIAASTVGSLDTDLLVLGEMGIGNTTVAAALSCALLGDGSEPWVGRGTGVDDDGIGRKRSAVTAAVHRVAEVDDPLEVLREVGGSELIAIAGAIVAARRRSIPVLLDGYVVTAAALPLFATRADALDHCVAGHCSAEPGHRRLLEHLGKDPLIDLDMRLGEASGAMAAVPLVRMACAGIVEVPTFAEWFGD